MFYIIHHNFISFYKYIKFVYNSKENASDEEMVDSQDPYKGTRNGAIHIQDIKDEFHFYHCGGDS